MDPLTQAALGGMAAGVADAVLAHVSKGRPRLGRAAILLGMGAGMAADLDVVIPFVIDLELPWTYHRHFTHALAFVPIGALLCTIVACCLWRRFRANLRKTYIVTFAAYATHGPLDACTSYGTHLAWPFSDARANWDLLPIVDPLLTLGLLAGLALRRWRLSAIVAAWLYFAVFVGIGAVQRDRALELATALAKSRGHEAEGLRALPLPCSLLLWRTLYRSDGAVHADTLRLVPTLRPRWAKGGRRALSEVLGADAVARFVVFADGFAVEAPPTSAGVRRVLDARFVAGLGFEALFGVDVREASVGAPRVTFQSGLQPIGRAMVERLADALLAGDGFEDYPLELLR